MQLREQWFLLSSALFLSKKQKVTCMIHASGFTHTGSMSLGMAVLVFGIVSLPVWQLLKFIAMEFGQVDKYPCCPEDKSNNYDDPLTFHSSPATCFLLVSVIQYFL